MAQKRSEPRYMCAELVNIRIRHDDRPVLEAIANLEDISPSGACIHLDTAVCLGTDIEIVCSTCHFRGTVQNCRYTGDAYEVGVAFDNSYAWDANRYQPAHLLPVEAGLAYLDSQENEQGE